MVDTLDDMNRRELLTGVAGLTAGAFTLSITQELEAAQVGPATRATAALLEFQRLQFGVSYHFSMNTCTGNDSKI